MALDLNNAAGILLLDKPKGLSSNQALGRVKRLFKIKKAGHTGSLDPIATGMLVLCFNQATKFSQYLLASKKTYRVEARLGQTTQTGDTEGEIVSEKPVPSLTESAVNAILKTFTGRIQQVPPMHSALKHKGKPLYAYARAGIEIPRAPREVTIESLELIDILPDRLILELSCSTGTYVRTLVEDIGVAIGCGAHVTELRRLTVSDYSEAGMRTLSELEALAEKGDPTQLAACLLPIETSVAHWPRIVLTQADRVALQNGRSIAMGGLEPAHVALYDQRDRFLGVGDISDSGRLVAKRLIQTTHTTTA